MRAEPRRARNLGVLSALALLAAGWLVAPMALSQQQETVLGTPSRIEPESIERVRVEAGARLREQPDVRSLPLITVDTPTDVELIERQGEWMLVLYGAWRGWVHPNEPSVPPAPLPPTSTTAPVAEADPGRRVRMRLKQAAEILGVAAEPIEFGTFRLLTDVEDERLLDRLRGAALTLADLYWQRFGLEPGAGPHGDVVLFADEADYREFEGFDPEVASMKVPGHSFGGLAAVFVSPAGNDETTVIWVHELTHLLNRRALGPALPPWLEEGIANDLSFSRIDRLGRVEIGTLGGDIDTTQVPVQTSRGAGNYYSFTISGATAALARLAGVQRRQQAPKLVALAHLDRRAFFSPDRRELNYSTSAFAVRYLMDGKDGELAAPFHSYLEQLARGGDHQPDRFIAHYNDDWKELQRGFEAWVRKQAARLRL